MIIRNNTFFDAGAISLRGDTDISGSTCGNGVNFYNNYVTSSNSCNFGSGNVVAHHNVFTSGSCGSTRRPARRRWSTIEPVLDREWGYRGEQLLREGCRRPGQLPRDGHSRSRAP